MIRMIKSKNLVYEYSQYNDENGSHENLTALNGVDIDVKRGEYVAILGHNGSGKSTLAKHMNALLVPTNGTIWIKGIDSKNYDEVWNIRQTAGMVFQNPDNQIIATIVEEDVAFGPENLGVPQKEIVERVDTALTSVSMKEYAGSSPHFLSGGQKQRVAIAGILAMKPDCIVLDEPTAMLDPSGRKEVLESITRLNREENITVVLITHFMEEAVLADRIIVMENGMVVMDGNPKKVFSQVEKLREIGLDVPPVTQLAYYLNKEGLNIATDILTIDEMVGAICRLKSVI